LRFGPLDLGWQESWNETKCRAPAFHDSGAAIIYAAANVATAITWFFVVPYLLGLCAAFDRTGRSASSAGLCSKLGLASGPYVASLLVAGDASYRSVINLAVAALGASALCGVAAARAERTRTLAALDR
jgi:hypothetical protein